MGLPKASNAPSGVHRFFHCVFFNQHALWECTKS